MSASEDLTRWAASGAMALTGPPMRALGPPAGLVGGLAVVADRLAERSAALGTRVAVDGLALLVERAALSGSVRGGSVSCGGHTRLLATADGWMAVCLARPDDVATVPAWLGVDGLGDPWDATAHALATRTTEDAVAAAVPLGLPVAGLGEAGLPDEGAATTSVADRTARSTTRTGIRASGAPAARSLAGVRVLDLSSLWAGPLCTSLLADAGATVVKVESTTRPDGARAGPPAVLDLLNAGKRSVALDFASEPGRSDLQRLIRSADVVVESSRPRALEQLGIGAHDVLAHDRPQVWLSLTAHGREGDGRGRVGFGDDAAVAGGLVVWDGDRPCFCADAIADPASGLVAAVEVLDALATPGAWLVDVALARVAAALAGPTIAVPDGGLEIAPPQARRDRGRAALLGEDTLDVLAGVPTVP